MCAGRDIILCISVALFCDLIHLCTAGNGPIRYDRYGTSARKDKNFTELVRFDGYNVKQHSVTTEDGYILGVFHIPPKPSCVDPKPIIFWHGLYLSSDDCIIPGPGVAHCYIYHENCYDMWIPNSRGNRYSRSHVKLNPDSDPKFWDFSIDEMAKYDLSAVIQFVLQTTGRKQLTFVGHSQSVALLILLCAQQPDFNNKIEYGFGMSTTTWLDYSTMPVIEVQGIIAPVLSLITEAGINMEFLPFGGFIQKVLRLVCGESRLQYEFCSSAIFTLFGYDDQLRPELLPVVVSHFPAGTSLKNFVRWGQIKNNGFSKYDYGLVRNIVEYGKTDPPIFDLTNVTMKWVFLGSENDNVGDLRDLKTLIDHLPATKETTECILTEKQFSNIAFVYGKDVPKLTDIIMSFLRIGAYDGPFANCLKNR